jgi:hypothetical protein
MKRIVIIFIVTQVIFISCKKDDQFIEKKEPGFFVLNELKSSMKSSGSDHVLESMQSGFNLFDVKASMNYSFILTNGGDQPIFDIILSTDNESFPISPGKISRLEGNAQFDKTSVGGFIPLISLKVIHGIHLNGVGLTKLLPMGINSSVLTISGKTLDGTDTISISAVYDLMVFAKVMDVKLYVGNSEIELTKNYEGISTTLGGLGFMRIYHVRSGNLVIENTGNVDIDLTYGNDHEKLEPDANIKIVMPEKNMIFKLDGNGTISDNNRIQLGNDGIGYFTVSTKLISW